MIYILCFVSSALFAHLATKQSKKICIVLFSIISVLIPSVLAGLRDTSIGTDVEYYLIPWFSIARYTDSFIEYLSLGKEPLFLLIEYIVANFFGKINYLLFAIHLIIMSNIYMGAYRHKDKCSVPFVLMLFYFLFFNESLNLLRQYAALSIIFANVHYLEKKNYKLFALWVAVATLFHSTAIIALSLILLKIVVDIKNDEYRSIIQSSLISVVGIVCIFFSQIFTFIVSIGLIPERFLAYITKGSVSGSNFATLLYSIEVFIIVCFPLIKRCDNRFYNLIAFVNLIVLQLSRSIYYGHRIGLYFAIINLLTLSVLANVFKKGVSRVLVSACILFVACFYWYYVYIAGGAGETYPYILTGIL